MLTSRSQKLAVAFVALAGFAAAGPIAEPQIIPVEIDKRAGKPTGGPAVMSVTVYSGPATCGDAQTPPDPASAGTVLKTLSLT